MKKEKQTYVKAKSIMTLMLVAARANRAKTPAASFAHLWGEISLRLHSYHHNIRSVVFGTNFLQNPRKKSHFTIGVHCFLI